MTPRLERSFITVFALTVLSQLVLGGWRARMTGSSALPALALAAVYTAAGVSWFVKGRELPGRGVAHFVALFSTTIGVLSAISAFNAPLIGGVARISVPLMAFAIAASIMSAAGPARVQVAAIVLFVTAFTVLQYDLTRDARWESRSAVESRAGGVPWNTRW